MTLAPVLLALALGASAAESDMSAMSRAGEVSDPELLKEMAGVESSNLSNAMAKGKEDAERSAVHLTALMASVRSLAEPLKADLGPFADEDAAEDLTLHAAALKEKEAAFRRALAGGELKAPTYDLERLLALRRTYPAADRRRDLRLSEDFLKAADAKRKGVKAGPARKAVSDAAAAFLAEAAALDRLTGALEAKLAPRRASDPKLAEALDRAKPRRLALGADVAALKAESRLSECALLLAAHDEADFDAAPPKKSEEEEP